MKPASVLWDLWIVPFAWLLVLSDELGMTWNYMGRNGNFWG